MCGAAFEIKGEGIKARRVSLLQRKFQAEEGEP
jgi:hypothetical protein